MSHPDDLGLLLGHFRDQGFKVLVNDEDEERGLYFWVHTEDWRFPRTRRAVVDFEEASIALVENDGNGRSSTKGLLDLTDIGLVSGWLRGEPLPKGAADAAHREALKDLREHFRT